MTAVSGMADVCMRLTAKLMAVAAMLGPLPSARCQEHRWPGTTETRRGHGEEERVLLEQPLTHQIIGAAVEVLRAIGAAIEVHRAIGPGLLGLLLNFNATSLRAGLKRLDHPTIYAEKLAKKRSQSSR